jgi:hypothetical protein
MTFLGAKMAEEFEAENSPPSSGDDINGWRYTSTASITSWRVQGQI